MQADGANPILPGVVRYVWGPGVAFNMPIYEYKCGKCDQQFEQFVRSFDSDEAIACPQCGSKKVVKVPSVFAVRDGGSNSPAQAPMGCQGCSQAGGACPHLGG